MIVLARSGDAQIAAGKSRMAGRKQLPTLQTLKKRLNRLVDNQFGPLIARTHVYSCEGLFPRRATQSREST